MSSNHNQTQLSIGFVGNPYWNTAGNSKHGGALTVFDTMVIFNLSLLIEEEMEAMKKEWGDLLHVRLATSPCN